MYWIQHVQNKEFSSEIVAMKNNKKPERRGKDMIFPPRNNGRCTPTDGSGLLKTPGLRRYCLLNQTKASSILPVNRENHQKPAVGKERGKIEGTMLPSL